MTRAPAAAVALLAALLVSGCGGTTKAADPGRSGLAGGTNQPSATAPATDDSASYSPSEEASPTPTPDTEPRKFGDRFTYEDGLVVKVGKPSRFTPSEYAVTGKAPAYVALTVTLINGTGKRFDAALLSASMQSNDTEADQVFDSENGLGGAPSTALLPNRQSSFKIGFAVQNPKDLVLELTPGFEYSPAVFVS